jgi:hypothetical protein
MPMYFPRLAVGQPRYHGPDGIYVEVENPN